MQKKNRDSKANSKLKLFLPLIVFFILISIKLPDMTNTMLSTTQAEPDPLFHVHISAPTNNPARMQAAQLIKIELESIGISCDLDFLAWYPLLYRMGAFDEVGTYVEGGMDMGLIGFNINPTTHPGGTLTSLFGRDSIPPLGYNMAYWSDSNHSGNVHLYNTRNVVEANNYLQASLKEPNVILMNENLKEFQRLHYDAMPLTYLYTGSNVIPLSKGLYGYDPLFYPFASCEDQWLTEDYPGSTDLVILANSATPNAFNTRIVRDVYNQYIAGPVQDALCGLTPSANTFLPEDVDKDDWMKERYHDEYGTSDHTELYPRVAKALGTFSADKLTYTIEVKDNVYFHDGHKLDAWDVAFSYQTFIVPDVGAPGYSTMRGTWGDDDKANKHGNYSFEVLDTNTDNFYETIKFHFNDSFGPWVDYVQSAIFPEHILGDPDTHGFDTNGDFDPDTLWQVMPRNFNTHSYNTGNPADEGGLIGPIGAGSMCFYSRDATSGIVDMKKFDGIKYDVASAKWVTDANLKHWRADQLDKMPTNYKVVPATLDGSLPELKAGTMNMLDPQWTMNNIYDELQTYEKANIILELAGGWQALWFNPKYKAADGSYPLQKHGVRHAISHVIPREDIVNHLLSGLGKEVFSPIPITHAYAGMTEEEMIEYKKTVQAADGSYPEADATTAWDSFDRQIALDWLETEGYDVSAWRLYTPPKPLRWPKTSWGPPIKKDATFTWKISELEDEDGSNTWKWDYLGVSMTKGDLITYTWNSVNETVYTPAELYKIPTLTGDRSTSQRGAYDVTIAIDGMVLDLNQTRAMSWFILPVYLNTTFFMAYPGIVPGFRAIEHFWPFSFVLPQGNLGYSIDGKYYDWSIDVNSSSATWENVGFNSYGNEVKAIIKANQLVISPESNAYAFDVTYDACSGILKNLTFPSTVPQIDVDGVMIPAIADNTTGLTANLSKLRIDLQTDISCNPDEWPTEKIPEPTSEPITRETEPSKTTSDVETSAAPAESSGETTRPTIQPATGWTILVILTALVAIEIRWKRGQG